MINCVYIHIPFCKKKCNYCSFCSFNGLKYKKEYIDALVKEINFFYKEEPLKTLYFGGGTPSLLEIKDIEKILSCFNYSSNTEVTFEFNPTDITKEKIINLKKLNVNRLSIGVQSFDDDILKAIGRNHNSKDIFQAIEVIKNACLDNYSIDLIYGLPNQDINHWIDTLDKAISIKPKHISLYGLKIEEGTYFYKNPPKNIANLDIQAEMYEIAVKKLKKDFIHYEFSSFAAEKKYISLHNSTYWKLNPYWGFGLSASGFIENKRYTNTFNFKHYLNHPTEKNYQTLTKQKLLEEEIFLGLRINEGINFEYLNKKYNIDIYQKYRQVFEKFIDLKMIKKTKKGAKLTLKGVLVSNHILCEFIE